MPGRADACRGSGGLQKSCRKRLGHNEGGLVIPTIFRVQEATKSKKKLDSTMARAWKRRGKSTSDVHKKKGKDAVFFTGSIRGIC